ncbi:MAG: fimbrillin family protein [Mediterranea sp.]|nr:fimbrillin family protein [Mediterranea sp.]
MPSITEAGYTRVANNQFEIDDAVGLFALAGSTSLQEERYVDNIRFLRSGNDEFVPDEAIFYPDDGVALHLISYFPYQKEGIAVGKCRMPVSVQAQQSSATNYALSDFLVASKEEVLPSKNPVRLEYGHKFFRLNIFLKPDDGEDIDALLAANPQLTLHGCFTKAFYDFAKDKFVDYAAEQKIDLAGTWRVEQGQLVGEGVILIPQETNPKLQYILVNVGGEEHRAFLTADVQMLSGKQRDFTIDYNASSDILMGHVTGEIGDWDHTGSSTAPSETLHPYVNVSKLSFEASNIYKVFHADKQVAEVCKEYLVTPAFSSPAIVAYPMTDAGKTDLSKGVVMQLIGQPGDVHGGTVAWNLAEHLLAYTPGTLPSKKYLYVKADGQLALSVKNSEDILTLLAMPEVVRDVRGGTEHDYPLVKIGTQYWMRENLSTPLLTDGTELTQQTTVLKDRSGYIRAGGNYFYTSDVACSPLLLPPSWEVPDWEDWNILLAYLKDEVAPLKAGTWKPVSDNSKVPPATNESGFDGFPVGMCVESKGAVFLSTYEGKYVAYWTLNKSHTATDAIAMGLTSKSNTKGEINMKDDPTAYSIRAIRKPASE